ncbi:MAG: helix-turn-helix domain-containing protein [Defluviitaleaceae bacterium]|nr:helix-turn-helix domain-containing protein [Defluviitaleaceae bacterium]
MAVFRIEKTKDYTVMSNYHLRDNDLSLKGKGLLSLMLSLPEDWDYTMKGLAKICKDGMDSVRNGIMELEKHGYLTRQRIRKPNGQLGDVEYTILEMPSKPAEHSPISVVPTAEISTAETPTSGKPTQALPTLENPTQSITNQSSTNESNIKELNINLSIPATPKPAPPQKEIDLIDVYSAYSEIIKQNIDYDSLCEEHKHSADEIREIFEIMLETVCARRKTIRIGGEEKPTEIVKSRLLKLDFTHIEYVLECLNKNTTDVRNIKSYLLTSLYNAPATIDNYYKSRIKHDFYGKPLNA